MSQKKARVFSSEFKLQVVQRKSGEGGGKVVV
jgi:hypothetical protein